ncbi:MAG TPA: DUF2950 domain-containing protein [Candidatus Acidoferrales bacterium]|nr:DUF2950 domain-containing protein [Candidatus Acidoferrales bacterium]
MSHAQLQAKGRTHMQIRAGAVSGGKTIGPVRFFLFAVAAVVFVLGSAATLQAQESDQQMFSSPQEAMQALVQAAQSKDHAALDKIFGSTAQELLSGDPVEDAKDLDDFSNGVQASAKLKQDSDAKYTITVGNDNWPFPVPIVKQGDHWFFDTKAGTQEILDRRVGENELSAITTCRAYVVAQWEYFTHDDWGHNGVAAYAPRFVSTPGQHDGLYWETAPDEAPSPLGSLVAEARAEGYGSQNATAQQKDTDSGSSSRGPRPFHGYYFKILTRQGPHSPGGAYDYVINGNMIAGHALIAYPDKWGNSGVMTFIVNQQGRVYEKNLGPNTDTIASAITEYDPDVTWKLVDSNPQ